MPIAEYFAAEHKKIDLLLETLLKIPQNRPDARHAYAELQRLLYKHIYCEEELLFPEVEACGLSGPTDVMRFEHGQICSLLSRIWQGLNKDTLNPTGLIHELRGVLVAHNLKEEGVLYPTADTMMESAEALVERARNMVPPKGWKCMALRTG